MKLLAALAAIARLFERLLDWLDEAKAEQKHAEKQDAHDRIDDDLDGHLADAGLRVVDGRREDGAPLDHVPGSSGGLSEEVHRTHDRDA